uniref:Tubulin polyglutamylase TTLL4-like n=2 Tax=Hirondellea gigas TaxID=1518452 RepID=A0A6A7G147_9CRUS
MSDQQEDRPVIGLCVQEILPSSVSSSVAAAADAATLCLAKRSNAETIADLCASIENKPLTYHNKRQKMSAGPDQLPPSIDNNSDNVTSTDLVNGLSKKAGITVNSLPQQLSAHNPLSERNIRVDNDHNNALNKNTSYDKTQSRLNTESVADPLPNDCENNSAKSSSMSSTVVKAIPNAINSIDRDTLNNINNNQSINSSCINSKMAEDNIQINRNNNNGVGSSVENSNINNSTKNISDKNCNASNGTSIYTEGSSSMMTSTINSDSSVRINNSLTSAISSLENSESARSPSSSTLDYIARLPDGGMRQSLEALDDVSATPPHQPQHTTPQQQQFSGDEDDDNYLDSSDDDDGDVDTATNNEDDESFGEDDASVISTVGSTCSLRSVASEALASICRNEQGQTTNPDGSLLYDFKPSTEPLAPLSPSLFSHVPPALQFCQHNELCRPLPDCVAKLLKWRHTFITPLIIRKTIVNSGFKITKRTVLWSGTWGKHMKTTAFKSIKSYQKINHFPGTFQIGRKDKLWRNFLRLQNKFGKEEFGFMPKTFVLPTELSALKIAFDKEGVKKKWIVKPPASARGTGIEVVDKWSQLDTNTPLVVQRYVSRPYLINNTKFDLRIYVLVTSFHPLRIYLYQDGLVRFASVEYRNESTTLSDRFMHLTNYSVNKTSSSYTHNTDAGECQGHRWTLCTLWGYLKSHGIDTGALWSRIADMVIKTVLSGEQDIIVRSRKNTRSKYSCFELFGFDVLLDEKLRPWLLEVNISPSMHSACSLDYMVKGPLMSHLLTMTAFHVPDHRSLTAQMQTEVLQECGLSSGVSRLTLDHRLYTRLLTEAEQSKHNAINSMSRSCYLNAVLDHLTPDDVRHLLLGEDELHRAGKFTCIFPTGETHRYFGFLDKPRYYNRLWDAWETAHGACREKGIEQLEKLCALKYHLIVPPKFKMPKVVGAQPVKPANKEDSISLMTSCGNSTETVTTVITSAARPLPGQTSEQQTTTVASNNEKPIVNAPVPHQSISDTTESNNSHGIVTGASEVQTSVSLNKCPIDATINGNNNNSDNNSSSDVQSTLLSGSSVMKTEERNNTAESVTLEYATENVASKQSGKRPIAGVRSGCKKSKLTRRRRPHLKVNPTKSAESTAILTASLVSGRRGGSEQVITHGDDVLSVHSSDEDEDWCEDEDAIPFNTRVDNPCNSITYVVSNGMSGRSNRTEPSINVSNPPSSSVVCQIVSSERTSDEVNYNSCLITNNKDHVGEKHCNKDNSVGARADTAANSSK